MIQPDPAELITKTLNFRIIPFELKLEPDFLKKLPEKLIIDECEVNLHNLECTCSDFENTRSVYPTGDIRRMCQHLATTFFHTLKAHRKLPIESPVRKTIRRAAERQIGVHLYTDIIKIIEDRKPEEPYLFFYPPDVRFNGGTNLMNITSNSFSDCFSHDKIYQHVYNLEHHELYKRDFEISWQEKERKSPRKVYLERSVERLHGILEGINIDGRLSDKEIMNLYNWLMEHEALAKVTPFREVALMISRALDDMMIDEDERYEIKRWCRNYMEGKTLCQKAATKAVRRLHGVLHGIVIDKAILDEEIYSLKQWLDEHKEYAGIWPFNDIIGAVKTILADGTIDEDERLYFKDLCTEFAEKPIDHEITKDAFYSSDLFGQDVKVYQPITYICDTNVKIEFSEKTFCFTGPAKAGKRDDLAEMVISLGGRVHHRYGKSVGDQVNYLVIGALSSPAWIYSTYGRKIETAVMARKEGKDIKIIYEDDFIDQARQCSSDKPEDILGYKSVFLNVLMKEKR